MQLWQMTIGEAGDSDGESGRSSMTLKEMKSNEKSLADTEQVYIQLL